jgi:hypothetical protein
VRLNGHNVTLQVLSVGKAKKAARAYGPVKGPVVINTHGGRPTVKRKGRVLRGPRFDHTAPRTRASVRIRRNVAVVRFRAKDNSKVRATYSSLRGRRAKRVRHGSLRLPVKRLRSLTFFSVDVFNNVERPRRVTSRGSGKRATAVARRRFCRAISAIGDNFPVRVTKGRISCNGARRTLRHFIVNASSPRGWTCYRGHGQDVWAATCTRKPKDRPRIIVRAYNPTS